MLASVLAMFLVLSAFFCAAVPPVDASLDLPDAVAKEFTGTYRFNYLFLESGIPYVDISGHLQLLELDNTEGAPRLTFFNQSANGEKSAHYSYVFHQKENKLILREFDASGSFRFDCVGTFDPKKKTFECRAPRAPKPARDTDSPMTRKIGLFKRPTSWPAYEVLDRHNLFRFYDWGFVNLQENLKLDADGTVVARETGVITNVRVKPPASMENR